MRRIYTSLLTTLSVFQATQAHGQHHNPLAAFGVLPSTVRGDPVPFSLRVPNHELKRLPTLAGLAEIAPPSWYSLNADATNGTFGLSRDWLVHAQDVWVNDFDWRAHERRFNALPNYKVNVTAADQLFELHFAALFSARPDAVPVILMHGWPGSWLEFVPVLERLAAKYTPDTLPYHVIVPSIPDYGLSSRPRHGLERELTLPAASAAMNALMVALGFDAYVAQGGDVGYALAQFMCGAFDECKAYHCLSYPPGLRHDGGERLTLRETKKK